MRTQTVAANHLPLSQLYAARYGEGRVSLPVPRSQALYANFSHITGVPAAPGDNAYSIDMLHVLNLLMTKTGSAPREEGRDVNRLAFLIQDYGARLHDQILAAAKPYAPGAFVESGMLFSLSS